jgi:hypothetical protein
LSVSAPTVLALSLIAECNLKAVALKPVRVTIGVREEDAQRPVARHLGQEHAPPEGRARSKPGGVGA